MCLGWLLPELCYPWKVILWNILFVPSAHAATPPYVLKISQISAVFGKSRTYDLETSRQH